VAHPEILVTVSHKLQEQQEHKQKMFALSVMENQAALLHDPDTPAYGPDNAKVAVIEFFDYQCVFCSRFAPELEKVMKAQPDVRYLFKEWPIFGGRWEASLQAAAGADGLAKERAAGVCDLSQCHLRHRP
jgi:protein-disulfide isomerase